MSYWFCNGLFSGANYLVQQEIREEGFRYSNPFLGFLSSVGSVSSILLMVVAFYFIVTSAGSGILEGVYFIFASFVGMFLSGYFERFGLNSLFSIVTLFVNLSLLFYMYSLTH